MTPVFGTAHFAISTAGTLVFMPRIEAPPPTLVRRRGDHEIGRSQIAVQGTVADLRLAPDGQRLAIATAGDDGFDLWIHDLDRRSLVRRTFDGTGLNPIWSPDGRWLLSASIGGIPALMRLGADGGEAVRLWTDDVPAVATSWSSDGRRVAFSRLDPENGWDLWILDLDDQLAVAQAEPWLSSPYDEVRGTFSPDGRFLAYESDETGSHEIYVRAFPDSGAQWPISTEGGTHPLWSRDGRSLWFRRGGQVFVTPVRFEPEVEIGHPEPRFETAGLPGYGVAAGSDEVLYLERPPTPTAPTTLSVLVHWLDT